MFRYRMIRETGCCWVDTDFVCLTNPEFTSEPYVFCRQADAVSTLLVNNAVLRLPPSDPALAELVATAESMIDVDQKWGALGPFLLTPVLEKHGLYDRALDPHVCYPIEPEQFWKPFLPSYRAESNGRSPARPFCISGAKRSRGAATTSRPARRRAPTFTTLSERSAPSIAFAAPATKTKSAA